MKILYIANIRLPTEKAHGVQIMEMASAFSRAGVEVELVVPKRNNHLTADPFEFYKIEKTFAVTRLFTWDLIWLGRMGYQIESWLFSISALFYVLKQKHLVYSRDESVLALLALFGKQYIFEPHIAKWNHIEEFAMAHATLIVPITQGLKDFFIKKGIPDEQMYVAPDGVNLARFTHNLSKEESRVRVGLPLDKKIVLYSGHLYERKGPQVLAEAAFILQKDILAVFVGGTTEDVARFTEQYGRIGNVLILGHQPHDEVPYYLSAADVLVIPNSAKSEDARVYTSPMKLFEYMTSGKPIVASDVPSLREVLSEECAILIPPNDSEALAQGISWALGSTELSARLGSTAQQLVLAYSWDKRAENILGALRETSNDSHDSEHI